jgi:opacity protein-like surface antigen
MRSVKYLMAAGAASLLSSAAFAADMPIATPPMYGSPVQDFGGWYLRGDIGFSNQSVKNVRNTNDALYAPVTSLNQTTGFDTGGTFQVGVGYQFNNWFRADITGQYRGKSNFHGIDVLRANAVASNVYPYSGVDDYNASKSELLFLANAYADLGTWWCVTPFIGAGIGTSRVTISNFTDHGQINTGLNTATNTFGPGTQTGVAFAPTDSKWNFAWALHTGLAYKVSPNLTIELAYSYLNMGDGVTGSVTTFDGFTTNHVMSFKDITSHDVTLGVRWNLESPPAYEPPLIRKG